ncbi:hypothetical protein DMN91_008705, partial [Ooceraea biroi]
ISLISCFQTTYSDKGPRPVGGKFLSFDHIKFLVGNAKQITFVFESAYEPDNQEMSKHLAQHGDGVRDVAFSVEDIDTIMKIAKQRGAQVVRDIWEESDEYGTVKMAILRTYGDTHHTLIDRTKYKGFFLPGYVRAEEDCLLKQLYVYIIFLYKIYF